MRRIRSLCIAVTAFAIAAGATTCGDGGGGGGGGLYGGGGGTSSSSAEPGAATVAVADSDLGTILVDGDGITLYLFQQDTDSSSTCADDCAVTWPPLLTEGDAIAGDGVAGTLGTTTRDDGRTQVTYDGHPLYRYSGDTAAGDVNGQGIGELWYAVTPEGTAAAASPDSRGGYG